MYHLIIVKKVKKGDRIRPRQDRQQDLPLPVYEVKEVGPVVAWDGTPGESNLLDFQKMTLAGVVEPFNSFDFDLDMIYISFEALREIIAVLGKKAPE